MRILPPLFFGLVFLFSGYTPAATTDYLITFSATQGPSGTGTFTYDDTPGAEDMSDISVQFGASYAGLIQTVDHPFEPTDVDTFLFQILSGPQDQSRFIAFSDSELVGFEFFSFTDDVINPPPTYEFWAPGSTSVTGAGTLAISAIPIPAALPLFFSALGLLSFVGIRRKPDKRNH